MVTIVPKTQKQANTTCSMDCEPKLHLLILVIFLVIGGAVESARRNVS